MVEQLEHTRGSASILDDVHRNVFTQALSNTLATDNAKLTFAQIVDGLPIYEVARDMRIGSLRGNPIENHAMLCDGVQEQCQALLSKLDLNDLKFDVQLLRAFNTAECESNEFNYLLVELVAVAVHEIAAYLYSLGTSRHLEEHVECRVPHGRYALKKQPTVFVHPLYNQCAKYPNGVADMVGYWAENRIFGGVVLFDRGDVHNVHQCQSLWLHPNRKSVTFRIFRLTEDQDKSLANFLLENPGSGAATSSPLPIIGDKQNRERVDPDIALAKNIYRDVWERHRPRRERSCCVMSILDYPELECRFLPGYASGSAASGASPMSNLIVVDLREPRERKRDGMSHLGSSS